MRAQPILVSVVAVLLGAGAVAHADDGAVLNGAPQSLTCLEVTFPSGAGSTSVRMTGGSGEADLYIYPWNNGTPPSYVSPHSATCAPYKTGNEEVCDSALPDGGNKWWACVKGYSAGSGYSNVQLQGTYLAAGATATSSAAVSNATQYYADYWKDNLFMGIAHHRIACLSATKTDGSRVIVSDLDYDGFSDTNYCRKGLDWQSPLQYGASSLQRSDALGSSYSVAVGHLDACGSQANTRYNTPSYARRSNSCGYNVLMNCNSDCWIREFSGCVSSRVGNGKGAISILSPCW